MPPEQRVGFQPKAPVRLSAWLDEERINAQLFQERLYPRSGALRAIVAAETGRTAADQEQITASRMLVHDILEVIGRLRIEPNPFTREPVNFMHFTRRLMAPHAKYVVATIDECAPDAVMYRPGKKGLPAWRALLCEGVWFLPSEPISCILTEGTCVTDLRGLKEKSK